VYVTVAVVPVPPSAAVPIVGACGTVVAVMLEEAELASDVPTAFVAVTVKVYPVFDCNPVTCTEVEDVVAVNEPGEEVTVYEVIGAPFEEGAVQLTVAAPLLNARPVPTSVAETDVGTLGFPAPWKPKPLTPICLPPIIGI
jgi:hypothetical protein